MNQRCIPCKRHLRFGKESRPVFSEWLYSLLGAAASEQINRSPFDHLCSDRVVLQAFHRRSPRCRARILQWRECRLRPPRIIVLISIHGEAQVQGGRSLRLSVIPCPSHGVIISPATLWWVFVSRLSFSLLADVFIVVHFSEQCLYPTFPLVQYQILTSFSLKTVPQGSQRVDEVPVVKTKAKMNQILSRSTTEFGMDSMFQSSRYIPTHLRVAKQVDVSQLILQAKTDSSRRRCPSYKFGV